ncbi:MAG: hypothetical protein Q9217_003816 [Psora testacea]
MAGYQEVNAERVEEKYFVRREDVQSNTSTSQPQSPNRNLEAQYLETLGATYDSVKGGISEEDDLPQRVPVGQEAGDRDTGAYDFRLFSGPIKAREQAASISTVQRVELRSPTPTSGLPGFVVSRKPDTFYFTGALSSEQSERYRQAVVSGEDVISGLRTRWVRGSAAQLSQTVKEKAEREKRNKKNRERKMKRRQKEREKKARQSLEFG